VGGQLTPTQVKLSFGGVETRLDPGKAKKIREIGNWRPQKEGDTLRPGGLQGAAFSNKLRTIGSLETERSKIFTETGEGKKNPQGH